MNKNNNSTNTTNNEYMSGGDKFFRDFGKFLTDNTILFEYRVPDYQFAIVSEFGRFKRILNTGTHKYNPITEKIHLGDQICVGVNQKGVLICNRIIIKKLDPGMYTYNGFLGEEIKIITSTIIEENTIGILTRNGVYIDELNPGEHYVNTYDMEKVIIVKATIINDLEKGIRTENGKFIDVLNSGKYYENPLKNIKIIPKKLTIIEEGHCGLKLINGQLIEKLDPGIYFENNYLNEKIIVVNLQIQTKELKEQTIITKDTVSIQIKSILVYQIIDSYKAICLVEDIDFSIREAIKVASQQVLSEYSLDDCMEKKQSLSSKIKERVHNNCIKYGVEIERIDIRDITIIDADVAESLAAAAIARRNAESKYINAEAEVKSAELMRKAADQLGTGSAIHIREMETMLQIAKCPNVKVHLILNQNMKMVEEKMVEEKITKEIIKQNMID